MTSSSVSPLRRLGVVLAGTLLAVGVIVGVLVALRHGDSATTSTTSGDVAAIHTGPQGSVTQFVVKCGFSHRASNDPIVHPGMIGMSHSHDFFGNSGTDATSTVDSLLDGPTTCNQRHDTAAYWAPTLYDHGNPVEPLGMIAYYRPAPGADPDSLEPYPPGLMMIAGDSMAPGPQPIDHAAWTCGTSSDLQTGPPTCLADAPLRARLTFPDCWDAEHLDSEDHHGHVAYRVDGRCPRGYPVALPQLTVTVRYPISGPDHDLTLASGPTFTVHSDFLNAWDQSELTRLVEVCLHRDVVCGVASNRAEDAPQSN